MAISLVSGGGGSKPSTQGCQIERPSTKAASGKNGNNSVLGKPGTFGTFNVAGTSTYKGITICPYGGQKKSGGTSSSKYPTYENRSIGKNNNYSNIFNIGLQMLDIITSGLGVTGETLANKLPSALAKNGVLMGEGFFMTSSMDQVMY